MILPQDGRAGARRHAGAFVRKWAASKRQSYLLACLLGLTVHTAHADDWAPNLTFAGTWDNNATNAQLASDQIDSLELKLNVLASQRYARGRDDSFHVTAQFSGEFWPRYSALTAGVAGGRVEWRHQFGPDPLAPMIGIGGGADVVAANDTNRRGAGTSGTVWLRKRFNDLTRGTLAHEAAWFDGRRGTYDRTSHETSLEIDRDVSPVTRLTFGVRFRDGDIVSHAEGARPDLEAIAASRIETDTFGRPMTAYRIDARTLTGRVAFSRALDDSSAIVLAYEWRNTKQGSFKVVSNRLSVAFVHQF